MIRLIEMTFGPPVKENKWLFYSYWAGVSFYLLAMVFFIIGAVLNGGWLSILFVAIGFPILFRIVYKLNSLIIIGSKGIGKRFLMIGTLSFGTLIIAFTLIMFFFADNMAMNASKSVSGNTLNLSIGSLKGSYHIEDLEVFEDGLVVLSYDATVEEGEFSLLVKRTGEIEWEETVSSTHNGTIEFMAEKGVYKLSLFTNHAKQINVTISF